MAASCPASATGTHIRFGAASSSGKSHSSARARWTRSSSASERTRDAHPELEWIEGGGYDPTLVPKGVGDATVLDAAVADRPVVLEASDHHTMWVNSEALRRAGIDASTPDPELGRIIRHGDGTPVGTLVEWGAIAMVRELLPVPGPSEQEAALASRDGRTRASGITWVQEAASRPAEARVYAALARRGRADDADERGVPGRARTVARRPIAVRRVPRGARRRRGSA